MTAEYRIVVERRDPETQRWRQVSITPLEDLGYDLPDLPAEAVAQAEREAARPRRLACADPACPGSIGDGLPPAGHTCPLGRGLYPGGGGR